MKSNPDSLAVFSLGDQKFALAVASIERIVHAVEIEPLPGAPHGVRGVINFRGAVLPVFDLRVRFGQAGRDLRITDHLVVVKTARRKVALIVDDGIGVVGSGEAGVVAAAEILPEFEAIEGVVKLDGDIVFIHDLDRFLSLDGERELAAAMKD